jgi:C1A family cysteine protease
MLRKYGWQRDPANRLYRAYRPRQITTLFPNTFDLPAAVPAQAAAFGLMDQGSLGSCTGFGCARAAWWGCLAVHPTPQPSPLFLYYNERLIDGDVERDDGSTITTGFHALKQYGICPETDWPYNPNVFAQRPPQRCYVDAELHQALEEERLNPGQLNAEIMDALFNQNIPVVFGTDLFQQFESSQAASTGVITDPPPGASPIGGHCMVIRGWDQSPASKCKVAAWKIMNSWGDWGDGGACWIPFHYIALYASDFWAVPRME